MFNAPYFAHLTRSNLKFLAAFTLVLCLFLTVMANVFTPETVTDLQSAARGTIASQILTGNGTLIGFMANSFYALMAIIFPMVYSILTGNRLVAEKVDKGSLAGFLSTPVTRLRIVLTSTLYLLISLIVMWGLTSLVGLLAAEAFQPGALDRETFLLMNAGAFLYHLAVSSICFCSSCIFNTSRNSLTFGAGLPLLFFVISLLRKLSPDLDFLKYFTLNTLFDTEAILQGSGYAADFAILACLSAVLYAVGILWFKEKDLPL